MSNQENHPANPPAFACAADNGYQQGMTLRDYFAAHAPITLGDAFTYLENKNKLLSTYGDAVKILSQLRLKYADEMLKQKELTNEPRE